MFHWIETNLATIVISLLLLIAVIVVIRYLVRQRKQGKSSCGGGCEGCLLQGSCHSRK